MATTTLRRIAVRRMTSADLRQVRRVERAAYGTTLPGTPFEREMRSDLAQYLVAVERRDPAAAARGAPALTAMRRLLRLVSPNEDRVVGFAGVWYTVDQLHVVTIAVDPAAQGHGIAQRLLLEVFRLALDAELRSVALEVRARNDRARRLYEHFGFTRAGLLRGYYSDNGDDAIVMVTPELDSPRLLTHLRALRAQHALRYGNAFEEDSAEEPPASA